MTFEETWIFLMGNTMPDTPETGELRKLTLAFYKAGEVQGVTNADRIVSSAFAAAAANAAKETRQ